MNNPYELSVEDVITFLKLMAMVKKNPTSEDVKKREEVMKDFMRRHKEELRIDDKTIEEYKVKLK